MPRLTITLTEARHRKLRMRAAQQGKTIGQLIEESFEERETLAVARMQELLEKAWAHADNVRPCMTDDELMDEANELVHEVREEMARERAGRG